MSPAAGRGRAGRGRLGLVGSHLRPEAPAPQREADGGTGAQRGVSSAARGTCWGGELATEERCTPASVGPGFPLALRGRWIWGEGVVT